MPHHPAHDQDPETDERLHSYFSSASALGVKPNKADTPHIHIDAATYDRERKRSLVMGSVMIGSILFAMLIGVLAICKGPEIRDRLEAQLYGERV